MSTRRRLLPKLGLALAAVLMAFGLCEIGARMVLPAPPNGTREPQLVYLFDPDIRYTLKPSQQGWIDDGLITVNAMGFRGAEVTVPKPAGRFRIVVIGDSVTMGWGVAEDATYSAQLEHLLHEAFPGRDLDVVNTGVGGYDTRQEVGLLRRNLDKLQPDLVLVGFYSNDVPDSLEDDLTDGQSGTRIAAEKPVAGQVLHMNPTPSSTMDKLIRKSRVLYVLGRVVNRMRGAGEWGMSRFQMELDMLQGKQSPEIDRAWGNVAKQFGELRALADSGKFAAGIIILPCKEQVTGQYPAAQYQTKIRSLAEPLGFDVIDPLPALIAQRAEKADLYIPYDRNHPSAAGHHIIGEAVFQYLQEHKKLSR